MNRKLAHHYDPTFDIAMYDTSETDYSVEGMEAAHETIEEARAQLIGSGAIKAAAPNALQLSVTAQELSVTIGAISYKSELKAASVELNKALALRRISNDEYNELLARYGAKKASFEISKPLSEQPWSPSGVLGSMPKVSGRDWQERAANDRHDRED